MEILFIVGSLRRKSFNRRLADAAMEDLKHKAQVRFLDWRELPHLDADDLYPFKEQAGIVREAITHADGIWIFCPEYNGSYTGGLKNVLDYASLSYKQNDYASGTPLKNKPVAISGAGGKMATARAQDKLIELLKNLQCKVMESPRVQIALPASAFTTNKWTPSKEDLENIHQEADAFVEFIRKQKSES